MKIQTSKIECPDCGCREIHNEYDNCYGQNLLSRVCHQLDDTAPTEPLWCYCLECGLMFDPMQEAIVICHYGRTETLGYSNAS
jgi:hypothetical protein